MLITKMVAQIKEDEDTFEVATGADLEFLGGDSGDESLLVMVIFPGPSFPRLTNPMYSRHQVSIVIFILCPVCHHVGRACGEVRFSAAGDSRDGVRGGGARTGCRGAKRKSIQRDDSVPGPGCTLNSLEIVCNPLNLHFTDTCNNLDTSEVLES